MRTVIDLFNSATCDDERPAGLGLRWNEQHLSPPTDLAWDAPGPDPDGWTTLRSAEIREHVHRLAAGLITEGVGNEAAVAISMPNRPEHVLADLAIVHAGGVPISFYPTLAPAQIARQCAHAKVRTVILQGAAELEQWSSTIRQGLIDRVIVVDPHAAALVREEYPVDVVEYRDLLARGEGEVTRRPDIVSDASAHLTGGHPATIIFTSGTTGEPKAVVLSHDNVVAHAAAVVRSARLSAPYVTISHLPMAHIADRAVSEYIGLTMRGTIYLNPDPAGLLETIRIARPTVLFGVPRVWEKISDRLRAGAADDTGRLIEAGLDRVVWAPSAGAPMPGHLVDEFVRMGIPATDVWGMTEVAGLATCSNFELSRRGAVGRALEGTEVVAAEDGELLVRGRTVSPGYLGSDGSVTSVVDDNGFLHTGDIGDVDREGYVLVLDRKKDLIITSAGKNISPAGIEAALTAAPLVAQALVVGNGRPFVVALLTVDHEEMHRAMAEAGIPPELPPAQAVESEVIQATIADHVARVNAELARPEQVKYWTVLAEPWGVESGTLTPSLKVRRKVVEALNAPSLASMYNKDSR